MEAIRTLVQRLLAIEPTLVITTVSGLMLILANFGVAPAINIDEVVLTAFNLLVIIGNIVGVRQSVFSPKTTQALADRAADTGITDIGNPPSGD
jgi:hypothetical protein